jgi:hypothetical protein
MIFFLDLFQTNVKTVEGDVVTAGEREEGRRREVCEVGRRRSRQAGSFLLQNVFI